MPKTAPEPLILCRVIASIMLDGQRREVGELVSLAFDTAADCVLSRKVEVIDPRVTVRIEPAQWSPVRVGPLVPDLPEDGSVTSFQMRR